MRNFRSWQEPAAIAGLVDGLKSGSNGGLPSGKRRRQKTNLALARQYRAKAAKLQTNESALERLIGVSEFVVTQHRPKSRTSWKGLAVCHHPDVKF